MHHLTEPSRGRSTDQRGIACRIRIRLGEESEGRTSTWDEIEDGGPSSTCARAKPCLANTQTNDPFGDNAADAFGRALRNRRSTDAGPRKQPPREMCRSRGSSRRVGIRTLRGDGCGRGQCLLSSDVRLVRGDEEIGRRRWREGGEAPEIAWRRSRGKPLGSCRGRRALGGDRLEGRAV